MSQSYQLKPNEVLIYEENGVHRGQGPGLNSDSLLLTNLNIVYISKGFLG